MRELFRRLKADGKRIALASSATKDDLATYFQILNVEDLPRYSRPAGTLLELRAQVVLMLHGYQMPKKAATGLVGYQNIAAYVLNKRNGNWTQRPLTSVEERER